MSGLYRVTTNWYLLRRTFLDIRQEESVDYDGKLYGVKIGMKTCCLKEDVVEEAVNNRRKKLMDLLYYYIAIYA